jgi:6-phosphogluconolactonase (cycloisomerase 2 family)
MNNTIRLLSLGTAALGGLGLATGTAAASPVGHGGHVGSGAHRAVFVQTDDPAGNAIAVYDRAADGSLHPAGTYRTGGLGGHLDGAVVDDLASQGSLTYDRASRLLYAVNAGSNTVTVFAVHGDRLERVQTVGSHGQFPVSVAVHGNLVYVLNARAGGSIQGYLRLGRHLVAIPAWHRSLGLDPAQTPEFTSTPGQVAFSPDGRALIVTTKGNGSQIDVFGVNVFGGVSLHPVVTPDPGAVPFAVTFDRTGLARVAEAGTNSVATYRLGRDGSLTLLGRVSTGGQATCWITTNGRELFVSNAASATVSRYAVHGAALDALAPLTTDGGTIDATVSADGRNLYVQTGATGTVDEFRINPDGSLTAIGSVVVPGGIGGEGIASS